jgi:peptide/nickel transport system substrate-binding protein
MKKTVFLWVGLIVVLSLALGACQEPAPTTDPEVIVETVVVVEEVEVIKEVEVPAEEEEEEEEPGEVVVEVPVSTRTGGWLDTIVIIEEPSSDAAINRLDVGDIDVYAFTISNPEIAAKVEASENIDYYRSSGSYNELSFNPVGPVFENGLLNPFAVPAVREAMNYLIDREYITQEIMGGLGIPRWTALNKFSGDSALLAAEIRTLELKYSYDKDLAAELIGAEMEALGATQVDGKWNFDGAPVVINVLIRIEDERLEIGDYVANQLEDIGFEVFRDYKSAGDASPIWLRGNPADGLFHIYTGGWITTQVPRNLADNFAFFYTDFGLGFPLWQAYENDPEFYELSERLMNSDFRSVEEKKEMMARALVLAAEDGVRLWLNDNAAITPKRTEVSVAADLYGGVAGSNLWAYTIRFAGQEGGSMNIAMPSILTEPWNALNGTNWIYDMMPIRGTGEQATIPDPFTGLALPNRIEKAEVVVQTGLPVFKSLDWVTLEFADEIVVPDDAWADWDAAEQRFITVAEKAALDAAAAQAAAEEAGEEYVAEEGPVTTLRKSTVYYPADLYDTVKWHDGSNFSIGDIIMGMILTFDRAQEASPYFDESQVSTYSAFMSAFKGVKIVSENPLVIETYSDSYQMDAELSVSTWWPYYAQGQASWHALTLGLLAEGAGEAAFTAAKADSLEVEWLSYIAGPTIDIMKAQLDAWTGLAAETPGFTIYGPTLGQYVTAEEVDARIANLTEWHRRYGHFWVGTGPYFLQRAFPVEGTVILSHSPTYPDLATKWDRFAQAAIAEVELDGPSRVTIGEEAVYDVLVTFNGAPYAVADIDNVTYLVLNAQNEVAFVGEAVAVEDGWWEIVLTAEMTDELEAGSNTIEVVVVSKLLAVPSTDSLTFVTVE